MHNIAAVFSMFFFSIAITIATVIEFDGTLQSDEPTGQQMINSCTDPDSKKCKALAQSVYHSISDILHSIELEGLLNYTISIKSDGQTNTGSIHVLLDFKDPKLKEAPIDLGCSVFPTLLRTSLLNVHRYVTLHNVTFVKPPPSPIEWEEETVTFIVAGDLRDSKKPFPKVVPNATTDKMIHNCLENLIFGSQFSHPLYPEGKKVVSEIKYEIKETVIAVFEVQYKTSDLKTARLDPTCSAFTQFLEQGLLDSPSTCRYTIGPTVNVTLKEIPLTTASSSITTEQPGSSTSKATTVNGAKLLYLFTWIGVFTAHCMPSL